MKRTPLRRKTRIRRQSVKQKGRMKKYYEIRNPFIERNPTCQICERERSTDLHHRKGRRGNLLFDAQWFMALCRGCHDRVHTEVAWAKEHGFLVPFWK